MFVSLTSFRSIYDAIGLHEMSRNTSQPATKSHNTILYAGHGHYPSKHFVGCSHFFLQTSPFKQLIAMEEEIGLYLDKCKSESVSINEGPGLNQNHDHKCPTSSLTTNKQSFHGGAGTGETQGSIYNII